jgi:hypothetical protein
MDPAQFNVTWRSPDGFDVLERLATGGVELAVLLPDAWAKSHLEMV